MSCDIDKNIHFEIPAWALSADDWAILLHASEKTQIPVLKRAIDIAKVFFDPDGSDDEVKNHILASTVLGILNSSDSTSSKGDTPFMDANCNIGISKNLIIYGHNMKNGRMFAPLMKFKNKECFDKHQIIEFITPNENAIYHIICVAKVKADNSWYSFIEDSGESHYNEKIKELYSKSLYHSDYEFGYNDEFLTLSTCEYSQNDGRLIVVAVKKGANSNV